MIENVWGEFMGIKSFTKGLVNKAGYELRRTPSEEQRLAESIKALRKAGKAALEQAGYELRRTPSEEQRLAESIKALRTAGKAALEQAGYELRRTPPEEQRVAESVQLLHHAGDGSELSRRTLGCAVEWFSYSRSQIFQDMFVLTVLRNKRNGFFVEFGAGDGVRFSNSFMLEKEFGWSGILAEPNRTFFLQLSSNRSCAVDPRCVWSKTGETLLFTETTEAGELSTLSEFAHRDLHDRSKQGPIEYKVETVSLNDLLIHHRAPSEIDYLSIDTEGSELSILRSLDFKRWRLNVITVEHNWVPSDREAIHALLSEYGFVRVLTEISLFDDWFVRSGLLTQPVAPI
jgi:FkbM family methyltransferase